jgi:hypothetical protein
MAMHRRWHLFVILACTLLSVGTLIALLFLVDPERTHVAMLMLFYFSAGCSIGGAIAIFGFALRNFISRGRRLSENFIHALRQGFLLGLVFVGALLLQRQRFLTWWTGSLLLLIVLFFELFVLSGRREPHLPDTVPHSFNK